MGCRDAEGGGRSAGRAEDQPRTGYSGQSSALGRAESARQLKEIGTSYSRVNRYYTVVCRKGICSLNVFSEEETRDNKADSDKQLSRSVLSYYYDENRKQETDQATFLAAMGYDFDAVVDEFVAQNEQSAKLLPYYRYLFGQRLQFFFDEQGKLRFWSENFTDSLPYYEIGMLTVGDQHYGLGSQGEIPGYTRRGTTEHPEYDSPTPAITWETAHYDGFDVTYAKNSDIGKRSVMKIDIRESDAEERKTWPIRTERGAAVGDTKDRIFELYPELKNSTALQAKGFDECRWYPESEPGFTLQFYFKDGRLARLEAVDYFD